MFRISIINKTYTMRITKKYLKDLIYRVNGAVIEVHRVMGPGLLERVYHKCLERELIERNIKFVSDMVIPIEYKGIDLESEKSLDAEIRKSRRFLIGIIFGENGRFSLD